MITVAIIGILSVLAFVGYRKVIGGSHIAEANNVLGGIKTRQEAYKAEVGSFFNVSRSLAVSTSNHSSLYPLCTGTNAHPGKFVTAWGLDCPSACCASGADWKKLGVTVDAPLFFGYSSVAGASGAAVPAVTLSGTNMPWPTAPGDPWFVATAVADTNGDGDYITAMISSFDSTIVVENPND